MSPDLYQHLRQELDAWKHSQQGQTSSYDFEKSFVETWMRLGREILQEELGPLPKSRNQKKTVKTTLGKLTCPKTHLLTQLEHPFHMSALLCERVCLMGQASVFSEAEHLLDELVGVAVSAKQVERVCLYFGQAIEAQVPEAAEQIQSERAYAMVDGSMLLTREQGWKEMKLGRLFAETDHVRGQRADGQSGRQMGRGTIAQSAYVAHLGSKETFVPAFEQALAQSQYEELVLVADGAKWIWDWADKQQPDAVQILDYYHAKQALWRYAKEHFTSQTCRLGWIEEQQGHLFADGVDRVIETIAGYGYRSMSDLKQQRLLLGYLRRNRGRMLYGSYRRQGLLIGSGPIESAHRNVIQQRLKLAGQRWSETGAQAVANLRVVHKSGHWPALVKQTCRLRQAA